MGGYIAMYTASIRPDLFDRIMTLATKFEWSEEIASKEKAMLNKEEMEKKIPLFVEQLKNRHTQLQWHDMIDKTASLIEHLGQHPVLSTEKLQSLLLKVRVGLGDKDSMVSLSETLAAYKLLKEGSLYILPDTKHPFERVNENLLTAHIKEFFK